MSQSQKSGMSDVRRQRLQEIQKREQLKGMLINKFKLKYGNKPDVKRYIDNEVQRFLANDRLTEGNLKGLDIKIGKELDNRDKKQQILADVRSQRSQSAYSRGSQRSDRSRLSAAALHHLGKENRKSQAGGDVASRRIQSAYGGSRQSNAGVSKTYSIASSSRRGPLTEKYSEICENDEWTAIQKFNTLLHFEEQKQAMSREMDRKRLIKEQLDRQVKQKELKAMDEKDESRLYDKMAEEHYKLLEEREKQKERQVKDKIMNDKFSRDLQLQDEKRRKRREDKETMTQELETIKRLQNEMEQERALQANKRYQEKEYLQKMLADNENNKRRMHDMTEKERVDDLKAQDDYTRMLDQQEQDRQQEMRSREQRAQDFMNKMADNVLQKMANRQRFEEDMLAKYNNEREMRQRQLEEKRAERMRIEQEKLRSFLSQQVEEKKRRETDEKSNIDHQAKMWQTDKSNWEEEDKRLKKRIQQINRDNQDYLMRQMADKGANDKFERGTMNAQDFNMNKPLLREINKKLKNSTQAYSEHE